MHRRIDSVPLLKFFNSIARGFTIPLLVARVEYLFGTMGIVIVFKIGPNAYKMYTIIFSYQKNMLMLL